MGFIERAFTPPGAGANPPGSPANPLPVPPASATAGSALPVPTPPPPPTAPAAAQPPPQLQTPGAAPGVKQRAAVTATTMLGAAATAGQTAKKSLLGQ